MFSLFARVTLSISSRFERQAFVKTLGSFPDRIKNLYFSYLFLLRAVNKVMQLSGV
jgi:hypothetical protein